MKRPAAILALTFLLLAVATSCKKEPVATWTPITGRIMTRWAAEVRQDLVLPEYPRPQMVRERWLNLNGPWDYAITAKDAAR
ncbi:MAG: glycoside hydrolase family 2, partial [Candidatus Aminicenantales bacterium]